jgi:hypothetical protein
MPKHSRFPVEAHVARNTVRSLQDLYAAVVPAVYMPPSIKVNRHRRAGE